MWTAHGPAPPLPAHKNALADGWTGEHVPAHRKRPTASPLWTINQRTAIAVGAAAHFGTRSDGYGGPAFFGKGDNRKSYTRLLERFFRPLFSSQLKVRRLRQFRRDNGFVPIKCLIKRDQQGNPVRKTFDALLKQVISAKLYNGHFGATSCRCIYKRCFQRFFIHAEDKAA